MIFPMLQNKQRNIVNRKFLVIDPEMKYSGKRSLLFVETEFFKQEMSNVSFAVGPLYYSFGRTAYLGAHRDTSALNGYTCQCTSDEMSPPNWLIGERVPNDSRVSR